MINKINIIKKYIVKVVILYTIIFIIGYSFNYINLTNEYRKCINKEYSTTEIQEEDYNEFLLRIHNNYSTSYKIEQSTYSGILIGTLGTIIICYNWIIYDLFKTNSKNKKTIAVMMISIEISIIITYIWFINNFKIG